MIIPRRIGWGVVCLAAVLPGLEAQTADALFDDGVLHEVRLYMHPNDWSRLKETFFENTYYPAELSWQGTTISNIGIRSRGNASRSESKPGLRLDFNRYVSGQRFLGLTSIILDNHWQDTSFLKERLSMLVLRRMGIHAPRTSYARLYVNDRYAGLYSMVEDITKDFLRRNFGQDNGYLYEYKWDEPYYFQYLGEDPELYVPWKFNPKTNESAPDGATIVEMIRTVNSAPTEEFIEQVSQYLDLTLFMRYLAAENFIAETDGFVGDEGMNNFYLYRFNRTKRFQLIPWDKDVGMNDPGLSVVHNLRANVLAARSLEHAELWEAYKSALQEAAEMAGGIGGWLEQELDRAYVQMRAAALEDTFKPRDNEWFEDSVEALRWFVQNRSAVVVEQLEELQ